MDEMSPVQKGNHIWKAEGKKPYRPIILLLYEFHSRPLVVSRIPWRFYPLRSSEPQLPSNT